MGYCTWAGMNEANRIYHDTEWGIPVHDDRHMFEHLTLECLQCGLSWDLMLKKRDIFRECFDNFDYDRIAAYDDADVERILNTEGMIRSPRKVKAIINNARCYQNVREEYGSFCDYIWGFSGGKTILYQGHDTGAVPVSNGLSDRISKDLKKRGFKYVGAITIYSHLQACGIINDHDKDCPCGQRINEAYPTIRKRRDHEVKQIIMPRQSIFDMKVSKVYPLLVQKAERKGRTRDEVDQVTAWLTGYDMKTADMDVSYAEFFNNAPAYNPRAELITGSVCGVKVEAIKDPLMKKIRQLDKLVDELAKGKPMEKVLMEERP